MLKSNPTKTNQSVVTTGRITTPLGPMIVAAVDEGICFLGFTDQTNSGAELNALAKQLNCSIEQGEHSHFVSVKTELAEYFAGTRQDFTIPLVTPGTSFQQRVWSSLQEIPYSRTISYFEQAKALDQPTAVRAVANTNGRNRIIILIPCHRVIGSNGSLTGYGAGLARKQWLLDHEAKVNKA